MGLPTVESVVYDLVMRGFVADVGNPGKIMPHLTRPVIAVNLHGTTLTTRTMIAYICGPKHLGQAACESLATKVAVHWSAAGADVKWGDYSFDGKAAIHITKVYGTWYYGENAALE